MPACCKGTKAWPRYLAYCSEGKIGARGLEASDRVRNVLPVEARDSTSVGCNGTVGSDFHNCCHLVSPSASTYRDRSSFASGRRTLSSRVCIMACPAASLQLPRCQETSTES